MEEAVKKKMSIKSINLIGWILFIISAIGFIISSVGGFGQCLGVYFSLLLVLSF